ncbi:uncharacterized protein LOC129578378 isoform X2 [Sitodiplosis mosellana]|nr:uncharacterized protein LOC129578378 isoform X2 [Sitodiplosis mosellana]
MVKSNKWCLNRINYDGVNKLFYLNEGDTTIGRNRTADITSISTISSRDHCVITLNPDGTVVITNKSSNGTYVNDTRVESDNFVLKHDDLIGLGCDKTIFDMIENWDNYYVFHLQDVTLVNHENDVIDLVSDDEKENDVKPVIVNGNIEQGPVVVEQPIPISNMPTENVLLKDVSNHDDHDDNELMYSQQILMDIKQEVNFPDENQFGNHEDDFSILIASDDSEDDESSWSQKLSQNQDLAIKKVTESVQNNKRKVTKQIEAIPLVPAKKARRNSVSAVALEPSKKVRRNSVSTSTYAQPAVSDSTMKVIVASKSVASTSKALGENENQGPFVDRLDPFAVKQKPVVKQKTFEDALKQVSFKPKKVRTAHVPKFYHIGDTKSILRSPNGGWPIDGTKPKKRVRFSADEPTVREYTPDRDDIGDIIQSPVKPLGQHDTDSLNSFENDPLHNIITDITEWKPEWLTQRDVTPPINGVNLVINPLTYKYASFDVYKDNVTSLLKHELWSSIQAENRNRNRFEVRINSMELSKRVERKRYVFHVQVVVEGANVRANVGDFVLVEADKCPKFFAYVTVQRFTTSGYSKTTYLTMEASESVVKLKNGESKTMYITPIANIRTELKLFNAIFYLDRTPFKNLILDPESYQEPNIPNRVSSKFSYSGYDKLNAEQMGILRSIYNKCLGTDISLSLIEGPPGTGKTRLIVSIILQLLFGLEMKRKLRILVLTSSNAAVDIIARRLMHIREKMCGNEKQKFLNVVRYGVVNSMHPDVRRIAPQNLKNDTPLSPTQFDQHTRTLLDEQKHLQREIETLNKDKSTTNTFLHDRLKDKQKRLAIVNETLAKKTIGNQLNSQSNGIDEVMKNARVVCSTLSSAINLKQYIKKFDVCFIDEASQCTEPWTLVPLQYNVTAMILVGDSKQLNPVVLSPVCRENNLERSLFARLYDTISQNGPMAESTYAMTTQYRMHPDICHFSNHYFYGNRLTSAPSSNDNFMLRSYSVFNLNFFQSNNDHIHYYNMEEAAFVVSMLKVMVKHADPKDFSYGIITPYAKQRQELQTLLENSATLAAFNIPVNTIDSYQGQERDIIILCTTRTIGIGFLANPQRLNVALTRAKKSLVICGNFTSISNAPVWGSLITDAKRRKKFHDIPTDYDFQTIADVMVCKKAKPRSANDRN